MTPVWLKVVPVSLCYERSPETVLFDGSHNVCSEERGESGYLAVDIRHPDHAT